MMQPWTIDAALDAHRARPNDRRIREALCIDAGADPMNCVCAGRTTFSDCEGCGLDVPPCRYVFALRPRGPFDRRW